MKKNIMIIFFLSIFINSYAYDSEDLDKIKRGSKFLICIDARGAILRNVCLNGRSLRRAKFSFSNLKNASFKNSIMCYASFFCANASHADFSSSDLSGSQISYANLTNANLTNAKLIKAYLIRTNLTKANLTNADLRGAYLKAAKLDGAIVRGANFKGVKGLTNEQKKYLREHGAINVPIDIEYDLESEESKKVGREVKKVGFLRKLSRYFFHKKQHDVATQTTKLPLL